MPATSTVCHSNGYRKDANEPRLACAAARDRTLAALCHLSGLHASAELEALHRTFSGLPAAVQALLIQELLPGSSQELTLRMEQAAELFQGAIACHRRRTTDSASAISSAATGILPVFARVLQEGMTVTRRRRNEGGEFQIDLSALLSLASRQPDTLNQLHFDLIRPPGDSINRCSIALREPSLIDPALFNRARIMSHADIPGTRVAYVGSGGGSDVVQCGIDAAILQAESSKRVSCLISVRREAFAGQAGAIHGAQQIAPGIMRIFEQTNGGDFGSSGRFPEVIPAGDFPVYLVIDSQDGSLSQRIAAAIAHSDNDSGPRTDTVIAVDTGGDGLFSADAADDLGRSTPELDYQSLKAVGQLPFQNRMSLVLGVGIDSPPDAGSRLLRANARCYDPDARTRAAMLDTFRRWDTTGQNPLRFGSAPFCFQRALEDPDALGYRYIPLPTERVLDRTNPWHTFKHIQPIMRCLFFMDIERHLAVIERAAGR